MKAKLTICFTFIVAAFLMWWFRDGPETQVAPPTPILKAVAKVDITPKKVKAYAPEAKARLKLPAAIRQNPAVHVLGAIEVPASRKPHLVIPVFNETTGATEILVQDRPLPWVAIAKSGALGLERDLVTRVNTLYVRRDFVQMKALYLSGVAYGSSSRQTGAKLSLEWRW